MKKILLSLLVILFLGQVSLAQESSSFSDKFKDMFRNKPVGEERVESSEEEMTPSKQAVLYYSENNIQKAFDTLISIKEDDRKTQDWLLLGNLLQDKAKNSDAIFMYNRALLVNPKNYRAYYNLGNIYLEESKYNLAIENYRKANRINNKFPYAYYNLGCAYIQAGSLSKAKFAFLKAIELKNTDPDFHYNLALTYKRLGKEKLAKQYLEFYNKLIENNG